jgi:penicillin amidase
MKKLFESDTPWGHVVITREKNGLPTVEASTRAALYWGQGWIQARDRQIQTFLVRAVFTGRMAELIKPSPDFIEIDSWMRRYRFGADPETELAKLGAEHRDFLAAHAAGINAAVKKNRAWELKLAGFADVPWAPADTLAIARGFGFVGLGDGLAVLEKWLTEMLVGGISFKQLKELFPQINDPDFTELYKKVTFDKPVIPADLKWLKAIPEFKCSNNWVLGPGRSESGHALAAGDPHLDTDRYPAIWQEIRLVHGDTSFIGVNLPGVPGALIGRTKDLSWSPTYSFLDVIDYRIEEVKNGRYRRGDDWLEFTVRTETIALKGGGHTLRSFYENENGVLCGDPAAGGFFLIENYSCFRDCGASDFEGIFSLFDAKTVSQGIDSAARLVAASFNWLLADSGGHIGYQMSGRHFKRPEGTSGLLPLPAWDPQWAYRGFVEGKALPTAVDPKEGYLVSANDNRNGLGKTSPCAVNMGTWRHNRIRGLIEARSRWNAAGMGEIQTDLYSPQAAAYMKRFGKLIPPGVRGDYLKQWDFSYDNNSAGAVIFENFYRALLERTFGDRHWGRDVFRRIADNTGILVVYFEYLDNILLAKGDTSWFTRKEVDAAAEEAFREAMVLPAYPLRFARRLRMNHILFGGVFPRFLGFDGGPASFPGSRATIWQGQSFSVSGRASSFCPSYRFLSDMGTELVHTALPGGSTDRRWSRFYKNGLAGFLKGKYKLLTLRRVV